MLKPSVNELAKNGESIYSVVIATAKRASEITQDAEENGTFLSEKAVTTAINDISSGRVKIVNDAE